MKNQSMAVEQSQQINTSLSQHGGLSPLFPPPNPSHFQDSSYNSDDKLWSQEEEDEDSDHSSQSHIKFVRKRRGNLPKSVTVILKQWLVDHCRNPYPTEAEKSGLRDKTGLTLNQISNWFINARRRLLPQILETLYPQVTAANRDSPSPKRRKRKVTQESYGKTPNPKNCCFCFLNDR
jgi:hypothetical protein